MDDFKLELFRTAYHYNHKARQFSRLTGIPNGSAYTIFRAMLDLMERVGIDREYHTWASDQQAKEGAQHENETEDY